MFEEEQKLKKWKEEIESKTMPEERLEHAINKGFEQAKIKMQKRRTYKQGIWSIVVAAILILSFVTSIRVSPAFANAIASIPGMERIVEMIQDNKGLQLAIENDHYQPIDVTDETENVKVTLKGIITDETSLVAFHTVTFKEKNHPDFIVNYRILDTDGNDLSKKVSYSNNWGHETETESMNTLEIELNAPIPREPLVLEVQIGDDIDTHEVKKSISLPFQVQLQPVKKEQYEINEKVTVDGQSIMIKNITVGPLKTAVEVECAPENTKEIFGFEDLRIVDAKGEVWTSIKNGIYARYTEDPNRKIYFLQSNYFKESDELYLKFNKLMALDKEEATLVINTETEEIVEQPKDQRFSDLKMRGLFMDIKLKGEKDYYHDPFSTFYDAEGKELQSKWGSFYQSDDEINNFGLELPNVEFTNPLHFPLHAYPSYIKGNVKIKIK
ncbi:DUF4179 domain-containing protein [Sporosarcina sp. ACRSL]|uniref:DUF4179 domain-containing protein n=1 Tax=Sporosarcina sp. ACRSL TaxID=2918215 RepID=UPI001EF6BC1A|nr:DUF4179 domain-containing protein [Sporosarcina sp. ACRSL]MCG7345444.1 DUF4179 domain-containing protein [Sporosarcina sp. ACRSL]